MSTRLRARGHLPTDATAPRPKRVALAGLLRLTRWREHVLFTSTATLLGINLAAWAEPGIPISPLALAGAVLGNLLAVTFAFMLNDVEDAPDDARDPERCARNPVAAGVVTPRLGWLASFTVAALALALFAVAGARPFVAGSLTLALGLLYSWRRVRLKAWPLVDVVSHALMLSSLLFLASYVSLHGDFGAAWWVFLGAGWISAYGQLYNQLRDYGMDRVAGLRNTASLLGRRGAQWGMRLCLGAAAVCLAVSVALGLWPLWLVLIPLAGLPLLIALPRSTDMRGSEAVDISGRLQSGAMLVAALTMLAWFAACLLR